MKHYFLIAKDVGDLTAIVCAALEEKQAKPPPGSTGFRPLAAQAGGHRERRISKSKTIVSRSTGSEVFERDPVNLIRLFWVADRNGLAIIPTRRGSSPGPEAYRRRSCAPIPKRIGYFSKS